MREHRTGATIDLAHDRSDSGQPIRCPTVAPWSRSGIGSSYDVPAIWRRRAPRFTGHPLWCGHFLAEDRPVETAASWSLI